MRALRHRIELLKAKLLSPSLTDVERVTLENRLADSQSSLESVLRGVHAAPAARRIRPLLARSRHRARHRDRAARLSRARFERTADDALGVISVAGRGALFAVIVAGPFLLLAGGAWWLSRRLRRRAARRLLETS